MRPKTMQVWIVLFLAVLCEVAEPRLLQGARAGVSPSSQYGSYTNFTQTFDSFKNRYAKRYSSVAE
jgi:hypothetical protein